MRKTKKNKKNKKKQFCMDLPKILLTELVFLFFLVFLVFFEFLDKWAWESKKPREKPKKTKKTKKTILHGLTQDSSHRIVFFCFFWFFWFSSSFWTSGLGRAKIPEKNKKNNFAWTYPRFFSQDCFGKLGMEKKGKNKICKNPTLPASVSVFYCLYKKNPSNFVSALIGQEYWLQKNKVLPSKLCLSILRASCQNRAEINILCIYYISKFCYRKIMMEKNVTSIQRLPNSQINQAM